MQKKEIVERDNLIIFDNIAWPKTARTNYLMYRSVEDISQREKVSGVIKRWTVYIYFFVLKTDRVKVLGRSTIH